MSGEPKKTVKDTSKLNILREIIKEHGLTPKKNGEPARQFSTGATRNCAKGKGRFDLIPPSALRRVARVYEHGAEVNGNNNWMLGMPFSALIDSATRHLNDWRYEQLMGMEPEEDHLSHAVWNILAIMHFQDMGSTDLNDLWKIEKKRSKEEPHC